MAFLEKRGCGFGGLTVEPPSPAAQRCTNGAPDGRDELETERTETRRNDKIRGK